MRRDSPRRICQREAFIQLGMHLLLPPWFEPRRAEIEAMLDPIRIPETNNPAPAYTGPAPSQRSPVFVTEQGEPAGARR